MVFSLQRGSERFKTVITNKHLNENTRITPFSFIKGFDLLRYKIKKLDAAYEEPNYDRDIKIICIIVDESLRQTFDDCKNITLNT